MSTATLPTLTTAPAKRRQKYLAVAITAAQNEMAYRGTIVINWLINLWTVLVMLYIWRTVYTTQAPAVGPFDWQQMKTYLIIAYALYTFSVSDIGWIISGGVQNGNIVTELTRPLDYLFARLAEQLGGSLVNSVIGLGLVFGLSLVVFQISPPASVESSVLFIISAWLGFVARFLIDFIVGLTACWTKAVQGLQWLMFWLVRLMAGGIVPLALFPGWLEVLANVLPFRTIIADPLRLYFGQAQDLAALGVLAFQLLWIVALYVVVRWLWPRAMRALEVQGG